MRRFADKRHQRMGLIAALVGNVLPIVILGQYHHDTELHRNPAVGVGVALAVLAPIGVNLLAGRLRVLGWFFGYGGIVGLTMMQADTGGVGSAYAILFLMPMIWFGLMASRAELVTASLLVVACCFLPMQLFPELYPREVRPALALAIVALSVMLSLAGATTEARRLTVQLRDAASQDQLTGLLNRRGWDEATERTLTRRAPGPGWCVVLLDLDNLKTINDMIGHHEGDLTLQQTGQRLREHLPGAAAVSRLGGDEFAALFVAADTDQLLTELRAMQHATPANAAFSAGIAAAQPGEDLREVMRRADAALYQVKTSGRGRVELAPATTMTPL